jgi:mono/diheme cytochrome c family protein
MKHSALLLLLPLVAWPQHASAQAAGDGLNDKQQHGRQLLAQSCGVCHLPPEMGAKTYGPPLNKAAGNGDDDIMREYIMNGTPRMPAFKLYLKPDDIDAIIAYVRTVPVPAAAPARPAGNAN